MPKKLILASVLGLLCLSGIAQRSETTIKDWEFSRDSAQWKSVNVPHDWAIYGPFDRSYDLQKVAVEQNGETEETWKTGRTGGLPYLGKGFYKTTFQVPDTTDRNVTLLFDGAMSHAKVYVNGKRLAYWPYGYNAFTVNLDGAVHPGENTLEVSLENLPRQSRWYPGAGLYRNVHLIISNDIHIPVWGTYITTPIVHDDYATARLEMEIAGAPKGTNVEVVTDIIDADGNIVATEKNTYSSHGQPFTQNFVINNPRRWELDSPHMYKAVTRLEKDGQVLDTYTTPFGVRTLEYIPEKGFFLNGKYTKFKGVCNHHDLGPLGAAVNEAALRHQIELLQDIGVNAIRTAHNMPAPELVRLCDEMGMMLQIEPFDDWGFRPKSENGYGRFFNEWAEKDITNMVKQFRSNPSVVMWSIGNEVPSQWGPDGIAELEMLQGLVHQLDPTRPVTCGMDQATAVMTNGFAAALDIPGFNYKPHFYKTAYELLPQKIILGTETASTVSSRGVYVFPLKVDNDQVHSNNQSSSYDTEYCFWSNIPDLDFAADDDYPWMIGQFVWTGFDYLGEPSPYDTDAWPSHSSVFGIFDLASLPKDRAFLYRSVWNEKEPTLHMLPHWTWPGREGQVTPVMVYTSYPEAELFVNGKSLGRKAKISGKDILPEGNLSTNHFPEKSTPEAMQRYRIVWDDVVYEPGEIRVVAYDANGEPAAEETIRTAGRPDRLVLTPNKTTLDATGDDLVYVTVQVVDKDGNIVPTDDRMVNFTVKGDGSYRAGANGDPTSLDLFHLPQMPLFSGAATAIVQSGDKPGTVTLEAKAKGVKSAKITFPVQATDSK